MLVSGSRISAVGDWTKLRRRHPRAQVVGDGTQLLMPGLVDAHSHGRALSPIQKGVLNDYLENNLLDWAFMPIFDPELMAGLAAWRHLRSGCTTIHHMGFDTEGPSARARSETAIATYLRAGIRLAFAPGVRNVDKLVSTRSAARSGRPRAASPPRQRRHAEMLRRLKPYYQDWYNAWLEPEDAKPFYVLNRRARGRARAPVPRLSRAARPRR